MWRLGVPKKYVMNIPISGFLAAITIKVLGRFVPEAYAFGVGVFVLGITLYPLDRAFARAAGRELRLLRVFFGSLVGGVVAAVLWHVLL